MTKKKPETPNPLVDESATSYAERLGNWYLSWASQDRRREFAQFFTPAKVARFMAEQFKVMAPRVQILDPGAGSGILACAVCESLAQRNGQLESIRIVAYEIDAQLASVLEDSLSYLKKVLASERMRLEYEIRQEDFVLANAPGLLSSASLFENATNEHYDVVIANPPYFKLAKADPRSKVASAIVHGQPNIYAIFMAVSVSMLSIKGELVFITPRSFASGTYFRRFREFFFASVVLDSIHVFDSRRDAFRQHGVLQENVILKVHRRRDGSRARGSRKVTISVSAGVGDLQDPRSRRVPMSVVVDSKSRDRVLRVPATETDEAVLSLVHSWPGSLEAFGIRISTGPVVPFRATKWLVDEGRLSSKHVPLLWMRNVRPMEIQWPRCDKGKPQYILFSESTRHLLVPAHNYVLLRRFSAKEDKQRLVAAPLEAQFVKCEMVGLENHLNYIYRPHGTLTDDEAWGLALLLNSQLLDDYFRIVNGNTQVSATEIRSLPLPDLDFMKEMGREFRKPSSKQFEFDDVRMIIGERVKRSTMRATV